MHEDPQIPNYGKPGLGAKDQGRIRFCGGADGEPGTHYTKVLSDGWTVVTVDGKPSAHVEHTIAITEDGPEVLTMVSSQAPHASVRRL